MSVSRRDILLGGAALGGVALIANKAEGQEKAHHGHRHAQEGKSVAVSVPRATPKGWSDGGTVITPNGRRAPWKVVDDVKVFHLIAEPIVHEILPGLTVECFGYNGQTPGPTIEVTEGDRCRFYVTNRLPQATSVHWHGVFVPNGMDGVGGLTQKPIGAGETFRYEFSFSRAGTFMYHPHYEEMVQIALGMQGMIVVQPRRKPARRVRDYAIMLHEWKVGIGARRPNPLAMNDFNVLTMNSKAFPATEPLLAERGDLVRIRLGNLSPMDHHPIHVHGHAFRITETDGGPVPQAGRVPETSVLVPVGSVRVVEFLAAALGDWPFHCHMTHHVMNQMGHELPPLTGADLGDAERRIGKLIPGYMTMGQTGMAGMGSMGMPVPNNSVPMTGLAGPFGFIDMGGMFTIVKIREKLAGSGDPGWYQHPSGTVAEAASADDLRRDGIDPDPH
jgi:FtsP/CotA-like multicopper oxidase with cupredoxin domain